MKPSQPEQELWTGDRGSDAANRFGRYAPKDELLHPEATIPGDTLTETWAYMFYIPEEDIYSQIHVWVHPNLKVVTAGIGVWKGHKNSMISAELMDVPVFVSAAHLGDGSNMCFGNSLHIQMLEPFQRIKITYEDTVRGNALDLVVTGYSPPVMRGSENHFDQSTWNEGTVTLRGRQYRIGCHGMRDRSWGQLRTEAVVPAPPFTWMTGTFADAQVSWHLAAFDDPKLRPDWTGLFEVKPGDLIHDSWIWRDGRLSRLFNASKVTHRDPGSVRPLRHEIEFDDDQGRHYRITGRIAASLPWTSWSNMSCYLCLTEWTWEGFTGWGDTQEVQWGDYQHALRADQSIGPPLRWR